MLHSFISSAPMLIGATRFRRGAKPRIEKPVEECMGKWIWLAEADPVVNSYVRVRKSFKLSDKPDSALIKTCANSLYKLYINGQYVGKGPVRSDERRGYFDTFDVAQLLHKGANVIAILAHHIGEPTYASAAGRPGLICKLEIESEGETQIIGSDETWKIQRATEWLGDGARLNNKLGFQEIYDAAGAVADWTEIKCKEKGWEDAAAVGAPGDSAFGELAPRQIPHLREQTVLPRSIVAIGNTAEVGNDTPVSEIPDIMAATPIVKLRSGQVKDEQALLTEAGVAHIKTPRGDKGVAILLDFGWEVFGNVEVGIAGSASGIIDLGYSEDIIDGHIAPTLQDTKCTDRILIKKGALAWQSFEPRAFRYLQIEFRRCSKPVALEYVRINQTTYAAERVGDFECSDRLLNDIWAAGAYTTELCMQDTFIDCPWREQAQWWTEARILSRAAYYAFNDTALLAQGLRQFASSQDKDGAVLALYPAGVEMSAPDLSLLWVYSILDYYAFSDDADLVSELYPAIERLMDWFGRFVNADGLLEDVPGHVQIDHADLPREGEVTALNCFYHQGLRVAAMLAMIAGKADKAEEYVASAHRLKVAINKFLYVPRQGLYSDCRKNRQLVETFSRQTNILAALFEIADQYQKAGILRRLAGNSVPELTTPYFASYYLEALYSADNHTEALAYMRHTWGEMINSGATTLWEDFVTRGCLCHGSAVSPVRDLIAEYVGIKPVAGQHRFVVTPHIGDLKWARGTFATDFGPLMVAWKTLRHGLQIDVEVPQGVRVDVYPPGPVGSWVEVDGKPSPTRFASITQGTHVITLTYPKPPKPVNYDEAPTPLIPHVQVLDHGVRFGRRGIEIEPRRKKRPTKPQEPMDVRMDAAQVVEPTVIDALQPETSETITETDVASKPEHAKDSSKKHKRRSHGSRRRKGNQTEPAAEPVETQPIIDEQPTESEAPAEVVVEYPEPPPGDESAPPEKKRHSRRGRSKTKHAEPVETQPIIDEQPAESEAPAEVVVEYPEPPPGDESAPPEKKRHSRRSRSKAKHAEPAAELSSDSKEAQQPDEAPNADPGAVSDADSTQTEKPKRKRRTYTRRKKTDQTEEPKEES